MNQFAKNYSCILWGERNHNNVVNIPLYIPYLYCNPDLLENMKNAQISTTVPKKNICAIISNPSGHERNIFLHALEKRIPVDYAGNYKTNVPIIEAPYYTSEFRDQISNYKFIISMENSRNETYITEKITHGFLSGTIPIYWGSSNVHDYFNSERFINVESIEPDIMNKIIDQIEHICNNENEYLKIVNKSIYKNEREQRTIHHIARDIQNVVFPKKYPVIDQIYIISSPEFEPIRYDRLKQLFQNKLNVPEQNVKFICPTYKQTITDEMMNQCVKQQLVQRLRYQPMKKAEISLFYNYKAILEDIVQNYKDGTFMIFESDAFDNENTSKLNELLEFVNSKKNEWDLIHIGTGGQDVMFASLPPDPLL